VSSRASAPRVLLQLPNWLGDVIMTTPLLEFLARAFSTQNETARPELHLAVRDVWAPLFAADPRISSLLPVKRPGRHDGVVGIWQLASDLRHGHYDAVLLGPPSLRAGLTGALAGIPHRIGHVGDGRGWLLKPGLLRGDRGSRHFSFEMMDLGLALLDVLGIAQPPASGELPQPSLPGCGTIPALAYADGEPPLWVVAPGTSYGQAKTWPPARVQDFMEMVAGTVGARIVLLGDRQGVDSVAALRRSSSLRWSESFAVPGQVVDLVGRTDLGQVVAVLKAAAAFVGNDSGLMHLAGALGVPTVGIFGSSNPDWTRPLGRATRVAVAEGFSCRPCYRQTCNQADFCMETITAESVLAHLETMLGSQRPEGRGD